MLRRIKYRLLRWLLDDVCKKVNCEECFLNHEINVDGYKCSACYHYDIRRLARKAWNVMYPWEVE